MDCVIGGHAKVHETHHKLQTLVSQPLGYLGSYEHRIYYHGGTAVAIEAGLLDREEVLLVFNDMINNKRFAGAASIGLTVYPPYPEGWFKNPVMRPFSYQNGR